MKKEQSSLQVQQLDAQYNNVRQIFNTIRVLHEKY
jgi:hypothetical protein